MIVCRVKVPEILHYWKVVTELLSVQCGKKATTMHHVKQLNCAKEEAQVDVLLSL